MARKGIISTAVEGRVVTFTVADAGEFKVDMGTLHAAIVERAAVHGLIQRISDGAALSRDSVTGKPASPADKFAAMKRIADHYLSGTDQWELRRAAGDGATGGESSLIIRAIAEVRGVDVATAREQVENLATAKGLTVRKLLNRLAGQVDVAAKVAELRGAAGGPDADGLLGELGGEG